jgi:hypothetical protein
VLSIFKPRKSAATSHTINFFLSTGGTRGNFNIATKTHFMMDKDRSIHISTTAAAQSIQTLADDLFLSSTHLGSEEAGGLL